jgi:3-hydroxyisobutyrate dehydrogenase-like beta-hydroxyacid dehydrogenase
MATEAETIIVSLPTPDIVKDVALGSNGIIAGGKVKTFIDLSTTGPEMAREIAAGLDVRGLNFVDSRVSGGVAGAKAGTLAVMVACPDEQFQQISPLLDVIGNVFHVGAEPGLGQTMKLANNLLTASAMALSAEAIIMGTKAGLDPEMMLDVINAGSGRNSATQDKFSRAVLPRTFDFGFAAGLMQKDVALYVKVAKSLGVPIDVAGAVETIWAKTASEFGATADITNIVRGYEQRAGVEVKPKADVET